MYLLPLLLLWKFHQLAIDARRRNRTWQYVAWSAANAVSMCVMLVVATAFVYLLFAVKLWWLAIAMIGVLLLPLVGMWLVRHVLVPLGAYRLAYYLGLGCRPGPDPAAYGLCAAAWALGSRPSGQGELWIANRRDVRLPLGDAEVIATALLGAARGDDETARLLLRSVLMLVEDHPAVRELAGEWLACDAAERGAWAELADDASHAHWPASPLTFFLEGVAARRLGEASAPTAFELWWRWLFAPRRLATRALRAESARSAPPRAPSRDDVQAATTDDPQTEASDGAAPSDQAALPRAIATHLDLGAGPPTAPTLEATVHAWDTALSDRATHDWLARRALELEAPPGAVDRALRELATSITDELARLADAARLAAPRARGPVGDPLSHRLRHGRLDALEQAFTRWEQRRHDGDLHVAIDEWREFIALQAAYTAAVTAGGLELRRLAFPHAYTTGNNMAVWLWNSRKEYALSHAISKWLLDEALAVGDAEAIEIGNRNCGLIVPTRNDGA